MLTIFLFIFNFSWIEMIKRNPKLENIEIAEESEFINGNDEMITNEEMKHYNIEPSIEKINHVHNILRKYNIYDIMGSEKKINKIKLGRLGYSDRKLTFNLGFQHKKREFSSANVTTKVEVNNTESLSSKLILISDDKKEFDYNYDQLKKEYYDMMLAKNHTLKASPTVKKKKLKEEIKEITDISPPAKCTKQDKNNYGIRAIECLIKDIKMSGWTKNVRLRFKTIILFWIIVYFMIVIPLWLIKGWCCCCCPFKFCHPYEVIYHVKSFIVQNPPGVLEKPNGDKEHYEPTQDEIDTFRSLELNVFRFR